MAMVCENIESDIIVHVVLVSMAKDIQCHVVYRNTGNTDYIHVTSLQSR